MNPQLMMTGSEYTLTGCGREDSRMRHSTTIGGTKESRRQPNCESGSMPILRLNGLNLKSDTGRSCCQIRHLSI